MNKTTNTKIGALIVAVFAATGCTDDPLDALRRDVAGVTTSVSYVEVTIGDSAIAQAQARDAQGNALGVLPEVASANSAIAVINRDEAKSGSPAPETIFSIVGTGFGTTTVTASSTTFNETIAVQTWPARVAISGSPSDVDCGALVCQVASGAMFTLTATALSTTGSAITGPEPITVTWSSATAAQATVDSVGNVAAAAPGLAVISATVDGGASSQVSFEVLPAPFDGGVVGSGTGVAAAAPGETITVTPGSVAWDGDEVVVIDNLPAGDPAAGGFPTYVLSESPAGIVFAVDALAQGTHTITVINVGPNQLAFEDSFDIIAPPTVNPFPGPDITAGPFPYNELVWMDHTNIPDQFWMFNPVADLDITATIVWQTGDDIDILWHDCATGSLVGNFDGANADNPQISSVTVPAGECWALRLNSFAGGNSIVDLTVTSP